MNGIRFQTGIAILIMVISSYADDGMTTLKLTIPSFTNLAGSKQYDWWNEALSDMVTTDLSKQARIQVVARRELKQILNEQELSLSGAVSDSNKVAIGNLVGANRIVSGSYMIIGSAVRIDAKVLNVELGTVESATSVNGLSTDFLSLEKQLVLQIIENLGLKLSAKENVTLLQMPTNNQDAIENNYNGIKALDDSDYVSAKDYFKKALEKDAGYSSAQENFKAVSEVVINNQSLAINLISEIEAKEKQLALLKGMVNQFLESYWDVKIVGNPEVSSENATARVSVPIEINVNPEAALRYVSGLKEISYGDKSGTFVINSTPVTINLHADNRNWLRNNFYTEQVGSYPDLWYAKKFTLNLLGQAGIIKSFPFTVYNQIWQPGLADFANPTIVLSTGNDQYRNTSANGRIIQGVPNPLKIMLSFPDISMDNIKEIAKVEIKAL